MDRVDTAQHEYESRFNFKTPEEESTFNRARDRYITERIDFHLENPTAHELDTLVLEDGCVAKFLTSSQGNLEKAGIVLFHDAYQIAQRLAEHEAETADFDTIMDYR